MREILIGAKHMAITSKLSTSTRKNINLVPEIIKQVAAHDAELREKHKIMFGNGNNEIGWDEQIRKIWEWIDLQKQKEARRIQWWDKFQWVIIPILVTGLLGFIGQVVYFFFVLVPKIT